MSKKKNMKKNEKKTNTYKNLDGNGWKGDFITGFQ